MSLLALALLALPPRASAAETLWHEWYLVSHGGSPISFYEETAEKRGPEGEIAVTQKWVEKGEAREETYIGSVSKADGLAPVAFFVDRKGAKPYKIDARTKDGRLEISFKPGSGGMAPSTEYASLGPDHYLASALPLVVARHFGKGASHFSFTGIVEDGGAMNVEVKKGSVEVATAEKKLGKENCRKASVTFDGKLQEWWVAKSGKTCRVSSADTGTQLELSTESAAKKALHE